MDKIPKPVIAVLVVLPLALAVPVQALRAGIATMYQELDVVDGLTVAENIYLGHELASGGFTQRRAARAEAKRLLERLGHGEISPDREVGRLSAAGKQIVSMARALSHDARLIIMDEPSAVLDSEEVANLFRVVRELTAAGVAIIYISHRLEEIRQVGHRITVLKDGRTVELYSRPQKVADVIVGRIWNFRDITTRQRAQDQARRAMEELAEQTDKLKELAFQDPLTGLANRMLFNERAAAALLTPGPVHVLLLDLDDFKEVNDVLGHHAGDEMLVEVSRRLQKCVGPHGTVARLGGDEFVVLLVDCNDADAVAQRVVAALNAPVSIEGALMRPGLSLGVASRGPGTMTSSELLRQADLAMYAAKEAGKNCYVHFRPEMLAALLERTQLTAGLRRAVELGQINVHYQPVVSAEQLEVVQFEALARWQWEGKLMPPDTFIQTAERSGLIRDIGAEVLRRSCTELQPWLAEDPRRTLAVNVSGVQLQHPDFAERVLDIAAWSGVDPHQLVLEVTESVFFDAQCNVITQLVTLRGAGIRVALDDFGTGYSSLGRLQELPVDIVKIDKSFVSMLRSGTEKLPILTSMIHMARSLGLKVTAEGIETPEQARYLMDHGCDALQGFLFSRPEPGHRRELGIRNSVAAIAALEGVPLPA